MNKLSRVIGVVLIGICFSTSVLGQSDSITAETASKKLQSYLLENLPEKVCVLTDQPYYTVSDTIWFQTYLVNSITHQPVTLSNVVYVELIDSDGEIVQKRILLANRGLAPGFFNLTEEMEPGSYLLRAYTRWMLNFHQDYLFQKPLEIYSIWPGKNSSDSTATFINHKGNENRLKFYPEGGTLLPGFPSAIGIKLTQDTNKEIQGVLLDSLSGSKITSFSTNQYGLGLVYVPGLKTHGFKVKLGGAIKDVRVDVPSATPDDYGLKVIHKYESSTIRIMMETDHPDGLEGAFLIGHARGREICSFTLNGPGVNRKLLQLNAANLPRGIIHFTLFSPDGTARAERMILLPFSSEVLTVGVKGKTTYSKRDLARIQFSLMDTANANLSVTVLRDEAFPMESSVSELSKYLYLGSDAPGTQELYNGSLNKEKYSMIDNSLLTQKWERFTWNDILYDTTFMIPPEAGITLSGQINNYTFREKAVAGHIQLIGMPLADTTAIAGLTYEARDTDGSGRFMFNNLLYHDSVKFILQAKKSSESLSFRYFISLDSLAPPRVNPASKIKPGKPETLEKFIELSNEEFIINRNYDEKLIVLDEMTIEAESEESYDNIVGGLYGTPDFRLVADSLPRNVTFLIDVLRQIPFIQVSANGEPRIRNTVATVYLDGSQMEPAMASDVISSTPAHDVYFVDTDRSGLTNSRGNPIIYVYTKSGNGIAVDLKAVNKPGKLILFHPGFSDPGTFHLPDYHPDRPKIIKPDHRIQLYWNPEVRLVNGKAEIEFYTGDLRGKYHVIIEGLTETGKVIYGKEQITVK